MNYDEIVAAALAYADRYDVEVSENIDVFILLTEARVNRILRTRKQSARVLTPTVTDQEYYALPIDYSGMRDLQINNPDEDTVETKTYTLLSPEQYNKRSNQAYCGKNYYTVIDNQIQIFPTQEAGIFIEMVYYQKVNNLNSVDDENWLSADHPDAYLSGIISEIEAFIKNYDVAKGWRDRLTDTLTEVDSADVKERWSGPSLTTKVG